MEQPTQYTNPRQQQQQPTAVYVQSPTSSSSHSNASYIKTISGILNILLIIFLFPVWVSIAAVPKVLSLWVRGPTENAFLFFSIMGFLIEIAILVIYLIGLPNKDSLKSVPFDIILAIKDVVFAISIFALSISSAVQESRQTSDSLFFILYNKGAFAAAAFFGFVVTILYIAHCALSIKKFFGERTGSN